MLQGDVLPGGNTHSIDEGGGDIEIFTPASMSSFRRFIASRRDYWFRENPGPSIDVDEQKCITYPGTRHSAVRNSGAPAASK